jgi:hypothetical protein
MRWTSGIELGVFRVNEIFPQPQELELLADPPGRMPMTLNMRPAWPSDAR